MNCTLNYIPERLHSKNRSLEPVFVIGEKLYYRSKPENLKRPYDNISLKDISHNRNFKNEVLYPKKDVLFNVDLDDAREKYKELEIIILEIQNLKGQITYQKEIISEEDSNLKAIITLKHSPIPCMYSHCVFEITIDGVVVNKENYKSTLGKKPKTHKRLREQIRQQLTTLIEIGQIDSSIESEYLSEP